MKQLERLANNKKQRQKKTCQPPMFYVYLFVFFFIGQDKIVLDTGYAVD